MKTNMQRYIEMQPQALHQVKASVLGSESAIVAHWAGRPYRRVVLVGAGSSLNALDMARPFIQKALKVPVLACSPAQLNWLDESLAEDTIVLAASQSGTSINTLECIRALRKMGFFLVSITQEMASYVANESDAVLKLDSPEELVGPKTMGVVGTILTAQLHAMLLARQCGRMDAAECKAFLDAVDAVIANYDGNIVAALEWQRVNAARFAAAKCYYWVAAGDRFGIAAESMLKLIETVRVPCLKLELDELLHGPIDSINSETTMVCLSTPWDGGDRMSNPCSLCDIYGGFGCLVSLGKSASVCGSALTLKTAGMPELCAYELLLPAQVLGAYIPPMLGIDIEKPAEEKYQKLKQGYGHLDMAQG